MSGWGQRRHTQPQSEDVGHFDINVDGRDGHQKRDVRVLSVHVEAHDLKRSAQRQIVRRCPAAPNQPYSAPLTLQVTSQGESPPLPPFCLALLLFGSTPVCRAGRCEMIGCDLTSGTPLRSKLR